MRRKEIVQEGRMPRTRNAYRVRVKIWIDAMLAETGLTDEEFWRKYVAPADYPRKRSGKKSSENEEPEFAQYTSMVHRWKAGKGGDRKTILAVCKMLQEDIPDAGILFELPIFELLDELVIPEERIEKLTAPYLKESKPKDVWNFPEIKIYSDYHDEQLNDVAYDETGFLFLRGDLYGFMGILAYVRWCEAVGDAQHHFGAVADLYRIMPLMARTKWFSNEGAFNALLDFVHRCRLGKWMATWFNVHCDGDKLINAIHDPSYPHEDHRTNDPAVFAKFPKRLNLIANKLKMNQLEYFQ